MVGRDSVQPTLKRYTISCREGGEEEISLGAKVHNNLQEGEHCMSYVRQ